MASEMTKAEVLKRMERGYRSLNEVLSKLDPEQMEIPGVESQWSVKDIVAHVAEWDRRMISWLDEIQRGSLPREAYDWSEADRMNEEIFLENKDKPLDVVLADFRLAHQAAMDAVSRIPDETLENPPSFEENPDFELQQLIAWETWEHYEEHGEVIEEWAEE